LTYTQFSAHRFL